MSRRVAPPSFAWFPVDIDGVRDKFGFSVGPDTPVFLDPFVPGQTHGTEEAVFHELRSDEVYLVDDHGKGMFVLVCEDDKKYYLAQVCTHRAIRHFLNRWRARARRQARRREVSDVMAQLSPVAAHVAPSFES
jgi:hypothetical protein